MLLFAFVRITHYVLRDTPHDERVINGPSVNVPCISLNHAIEKIMMRFEGRQTIFDIAEQVGLDYQTVHDYVENLNQRDS